MLEFLQQVLDWSEVWALLVPLAVYMRYRKQFNAFRAVIIYLWLALIINLVIDVVWKAEVYFPGTRAGLPRFLADNNYLYNVHSLVRFACFSAFFIRLDRGRYTQLKKTIAGLALLFVVVNFYFEDFFKPNSFSSRLLATEAGLLLFYCLLYFFTRLQDEAVEARRGGEFWIVLGLSTYVVFNFFIFLFYSSLDVNMQVFLWNIHNASFIIFCTFIAIGFYAARHH